MALAEEEKLLFASFAKGKVNRLTQIIRFPVYSKLFRFCKAFRKKQAQLCCQAPNKAGRFYFQPKTVIAQRKVERIISPKFVINF